MLPEIATVAVKLAAIAFFRGSENSYSMNFSTVPIQENVCLRDFTVRCRLLRRRIAVINGDFLRFRRDFFFAVYARAV